MSKCYDNPDYDDSESNIQNTWNQHPKVEQERKKNFYCGDEVDYDDKCLEQCDRCVDATGVDYGYLPEEAAVINYKKLYEGEPLTQDVPIDAFKQGAKWQQKRSYSEEDMKLAWEEGNKDATKCMANGKDKKCYCTNEVHCQHKRLIEFEEWFKQFKKK